MPWWLFLAEELFEIDFYEFRLKFNKFGCECLRVCWIIELFSDFIILTFIASSLLVFWFCLRTRFYHFFSLRKEYSRFDWLRVLITDFITGWIASPSNTGDADKNSTFDAQLVYATHLGLSIAIDWTKTKRRNGNNRHFMLIERFLPLSAMASKTKTLSKTFVGFFHPALDSNSHSAERETLQSLSIAILT